MGGCLKTSTYVVIRKVPPSPYLRSKMGTALAASPKLSGHLVTATLVILLPCSSTWRDRGPSPTQQKSTRRFIVRVPLDLALLELVTVNYLHRINNLITIKIACHMQMNLVMRSPCKTGRTCWLTIRIYGSQLQSWKSGKSNSL
jgi:hypothetical protein